MSRPNFRCNDNLLAEIKQRGPVSKSIRTALERYYKLLEDARNELRARLTDSEPSPEPWFCRLADLLEGHAYGDTLSPLETVAVQDALERYELAAATGLPIDPAHILD